MTERMGQEELRLADLIVELPGMSAEVPDWSRERGEPGRRWRPWTRLLRCVRDYQYWRQHWGPLGWLLAHAAVLRWRFWSAVCGAEIPLTCHLGGGLMIPHPNGIVLHPDAVLGVNCLLFQQVTIGVGGPLPGVPRIGGHVDIGAGARILGGVTIGNHAKIGANAVVLCDVPPGATAIGVPARILEATAPLTPTPTPTKPKPTPEEVAAA